MQESSVIQEDFDFGLTSKIKNYLKTKARSVIKGQVRGSLATGIASKFPYGTQTIVEEAIKFYDDEITDFIIEKINSKL